MKKFTSNGNRGFSLIAVLGFLLLVSSVLIPLSLASHNRLLTAKSRLDALQSNMSSQVIRTIVASKFSNSDFALDKTPAATLFNCLFEEMKVQIEIQEFHGLIDLNSANQDLLFIGLLALGVPDINATELAKSIISSRSRTQADAAISTHKPEGGEKNSSFESVTELHDFEVLRSFPRIRLEEIFTIHKKSALISLSYAHPDLQRELQTLIDRNEKVPFISPSIINGIGFQVTVFVQQPNQPWFGERGYYRRHNISGATDFKLIERARFNFLARKILTSSHDTVRCEHYIGEEFFASKVDA